MLRVLKMLDNLLNFQTAGIIGNFSVNIISLLYFIRIFVAKIDDRFLWLMSLLSPPAFTLALDKVRVYFTPMAIFPLHRPRVKSDLFQALTLDMDGRGQRLDNLWSGPGLSFGHGLVFLCFDNFLYATFAYYLDLVIPGNLSSRSRTLRDAISITIYHSHFRATRHVFNKGEKMKNF